MSDVESILMAHLKSVDVAALRAEYLANDDFLFVPSFLPDGLLGRLQAEVEKLRPHIHRNYIPRQKKGGSVDYETLRQVAPTIHDVYSSPAFFAFLTELTGEAIQYCPDTDLHRCALYAYTEPGDHIGWHYDTSFYRGRRFTVLLALVNDASSRLAYRLHTRNPGHEVVEGSVATPPGALVVFDGDKLHHAVTPLGVGEQRFLVTMEFVTDPSMSWAMRLVSNVKDAWAYFGLRKVFSRHRAGAAATP